MVLSNASVGGDILVASLTRVGGVSNVDILPEALMSFNLYL